ncbi:MAG: endonuclease/exonuclease/phosphatase family protein, partial [Candidatus Heimdallarchaeota archaeon]|nr:endonuclease/exonuclease/phosphatase family protein [Candidatus Heimdallarchaeota archaeon]
MGVRNSGKLVCVGLLLSLFALRLDVNPVHATDLEVQVLSFNILKNNAASDSEGTNWSITQTEKVNRIVEVVNTTGADIVGFQEGQNHVSEVFNQLGGAGAGWYLQQQSNPGGVWGTRYIMSKYPINIMSNNGLGAQLQLNAVTTAWFFNIHLPYNAYGPYYVRDNLGGSTQDYLDSTQLTYNTMQFVLNDIAASTGPADTVFLTGDFNDPSHLDWTQDAADAGLHFGKAVPWITSTMVQDAGFSDSYRETYSDEVNHLGETWSSIYTPDVQDRIDFVYYRGNQPTLSGSQVIGEFGAPALANVDLPIVNYPSDHRVVVSSFT